MFEMQSFLHRPILINVDDFEGFVLEGISDARFFPDTCLVLPDEGVWEPALIIDLPIQLVAFEVL